MVTHGDLYMGHGPIYNQVPALMSATACGPPAVLSIAQGSKPLWRSFCVVQRGYKSRIVFEQLQVEPVNSDLQTQCSVRTNWQSNLSILARKTALTATTVIGAISGSRKQ